jgi:hypothetical protein
MMYATILQDPETSGRQERGALEGIVNKDENTGCLDQFGGFGPPARYGLQIPVAVSIFQLVAQVIDTVVPLIVSGCQM